MSRRPAVQTLVAVTPDGARTVLALSCGGIKIFDLQAGRIVRVHEGHPKRTVARPACAFTPDGLRIVSYRDYGKLRLRDTINGEEIAVFTVETRIRSCAFARNGRVIIAYDGLRLHQLEIVEADESKPAIGRAKIQLLHPQDQGDDFCD